MVRHFWKLLPKPARENILERFPVLDRSGVNKILSGNLRLPDDFVRHSCIFIHIPKCAGSSIKDALFPGRTHGHMPLWFYEQNFQEFYARAFKFAFVRDPLDRAYSAYRYLRSDLLEVERDVAAHRLAKKYDGFEAFVRHWLCEETAQRQIHFVPQWQFLCDSLGDIGVDFIGRQEDLAGAFAQVCQRLGVKSALPVVNAGTVPALESQFSTATVDRIRRVYARDYELFGY